MAKRGFPLLVVAVCVPALALVAGCGSSSSSSSSSTGTAAPPVSTAGTGDFKTQWGSVKTQADALVNDLLKAVRSGPKSSASEIQTQFKALADRAQKLAAQVKSLKPPPEVKAGVDQFRSALEKSAQDLRKAVSEAAGGNLSQAQSTALSLVGDVALIKAAVELVSRQVGV